MANSRLYFTSPAEVFEEALPLGAGKLGAMVYAETARERIGLNYDELWTGFPRNENRENAVADYVKARTLAYEGKLKTAQRLIEKKLASPCVQAYQPAGDVVIGKPDLPVNEYSRSLSLDTAVATAAYAKNGVRYTETYFTSAPRDCLVVRIASDKKASVSIRVGYDCPLRFQTGCDNGTFFADGECMFDSLQNREADPKRDIHYSDKDAERGIQFRTAIKALSEGGETEISDEGIRIAGADNVTLFIAIESSFAGYERHPFLNGKEYKNAAVRKVADAAKIPYETLLEEHIADHRRYYDRVTLSLDGEHKNDVPTPERLKAFETDRSDTGLYELLFDFGRYLTIAGSRPGSQPMNLQGIWNHKVDPPWNADYTVNINTEMNYFPTLECDLAEMLEPLTHMLRELSVRGEETAQKYYGAHGFCVHHNTDLWRCCQPVRGSAQWSFWPMAGGWLSRHLFEEYEYTLNTDFLRDTVYPILRSAARFYLDVLTESPDGYLIFAPSTSPENAFIHRGVRCQVSLTTTMTMSIIREVFENTLTSADALGIKDDILEEIRSALPRLLPYRIGSDGRLLEWYNEHKDAEPHHRHLSHLYGLYPARQITPEKTPELAEAAKKSLEVRGDPSTGWSLGWKINLWARLFDGDRALKLIDLQLRAIPAGNGRTNYVNGGGTYPNMFDAHPPFQIDGNFGAASGIAQMLLQSDGETVWLLPALPERWKSGSVKGLRAKGGAKVDITWENGRITNYQINGGRPCRVVKCR